MTVTISGLSSVSDRILYTKKGPIVKKPVALLAGANLRVVSDTDVVMPTASFGPSVVGKTVTISGSTGGRNDGTFVVTALRNSTRLSLGEVSFDYSDYLPTVARVVSLANDLRAKFNAHIAAVTSPPSVHGSYNPADAVTSPTAVDLASANILLNQLRLKFAAHILMVGPMPVVHTVPDLVNEVFYPVASGLAEAILLANEIRDRFEAHRDGLSWHEVRDVVNRVTAPTVKVVRGTGPLVEPLLWTLSDPRFGQIADDPSDVSVLVNGLPASVDAVFGLLGAVVLSLKPAPADTVSIDYSWLKDPPLQFERLNSPEFVLNQTPGKGLSGFPGHTYRTRSTLVDPRDPRTVRSPALPLRTWWKYKGLERGYTASLNDPNTLLTNVPNNRVAYPVLEATVFETVTRYDPTTLPEDASDPWTLEGTGTVSLASGGGELVIVDSNSHQGPGESPPFYSHKADFTFPSTVSSAFRMRITDPVSDGAFTGVGFGVSDGPVTALVGFLETTATNQSSAIVRANAVKAAYGLHLVTTGVHIPNDDSDAVDVVDATDLTSLIILANRTKSLYNSHLAKGGGSVHLLTDAPNAIVSPDSSDLPSAIVLVNELADRYNVHREASGVHYFSDVSNVVHGVRQVGILTSRGFLEDEGSWDSAAVDWTIFTTYRLYRDSDGNFSLYISGGVIPSVTVARPDLPVTSGLDIRIDQAQQVFFGAVWRGAKSTSGWAFIRANITPLDSNQTGDNKSVLYDATILPEVDILAPWVTIGQGGAERILTALPNRLSVDSTSNVPASTVDALGLTTGEYKGFLRSEPILSLRTSAAVEFLASVAYYTFSVDNKSAGVFIDDDTFSTHFVFLQHSPTPATVTGTSTAPFPIASFDTATISIGAALPLTIVFPLPVTTVAAVAAVINAAVGFTLASDDGFGRVKLTDSALGAGSKLTIVGGVAFQKLGLAAGTYSGRDSNPELKLSWFGESLPEQDIPGWSGSGTQTPAMFGRILRITDASVSDYRTYTQADSLYMAPVVSPASDWKVDARFTVLSYTPGDRVMSGTNLHFAGVLLNVDEGPSGKSVEVQTATDDTGLPFLNVLSYNVGGDTLDQIASFPFAWNDGKPHTVNVFTSKLSGLCILLADAVSLGTFPYAALNPGFSGPSISFGSGGSPVSNCDLGTAVGTVDWSSVTVFKDSKLSDPMAASRRYVGIYGGGDPSLLSSYYLHQVDWTVPHTYRIVRDPITSVAVYVDGVSVPSISVSYDSLKLPPSSSSFLKGISDSRQVIAFGGFNPMEVSRTTWGPIKYSLGKISVTDRRIPPHQVLNQGNAFASPEHLRTPVAHLHQGFKVYSGGTPLDDFMYDRSVPAFTQLGYGTAPVPMTQDLESRGGLIKTVLQASAIDPLSFINTMGYLSDLEDDKYNTVTDPLPVLLSEAVSFLNSAVAAFNSHLVYRRVHVTDDAKDAVVTPEAIDLPTAIARANLLKLRYNVHRSAESSDSGSLVHVNSDILNAVVAPDAFDLTSLIALLTAFKPAFNAHLIQPDVHGSTVFIRLSPPPRVIYEGTKFFRVDPDEDGLVGPEPAGRGRLPEPIGRPFDEDAVGVMHDTVSLVDTFYSF